MFQINVGYFLLLKHLKYVHQVLESTWIYLGIFSLWQNVGHKI